MLYKVFAFLCVLGTQAATTETTDSHGIAATVDSHETTARVDSHETAAPVDSSFHGAAAL